MLKYVWDGQRRKLRAVPAGGNGEGGEGGEGGGSGGGGTGGAGEGGEGGGSGGDTPKTFSQEDVNRIATREKEQGKQAASRELAEQLGVSVEEAKQIIQRAKEADDAQKTEAQRAREAADREKEEAALEKRAATTERHEAAVERRLVMAGVTDEKKLARVMRMVTVEPGASSDEIQTDVDQLKTDFPELFTVQQGGGGGRRVPDSDPKGGPPPRKGAEDAYSKGAERAKAYAGGGVQYDNT